MNDFISLGIRRELAAVLARAGIQKPTPIQEKAIPLLLSGQDTVAQAQTGTGKTLAFLLPILEKLKPGATYVQAIIITPTRELSLQIAGVAKPLLESLGMEGVSLHGGQEVEAQTGKLRGHPQVVIGSPGRLLDHVHNDRLHLSRVTHLVLDEADQMLHMGFLAELEALIQQVPRSRQTVLFSATIPAKIRNLADRYMRKPADIRIKTPTITLEAIRQLMIEIQPEDKTAQLIALIEKWQPYLALVFCHTKEGARQLSLELGQAGLAVDELHGDLSQAKRRQVLKQFTDAKLQVLVASDIAARGLDIEGITHVFNYDIPHDPETYIHRIGRTGRAGETGMAVTFVTPHEKGWLRQIEQGIETVVEKQLLSGKTVTKAPLRSKRLALQAEETAENTGKVSRQRKAKGKDPGKKSVIRNVHKKPGKK